MGAERLCQRVTGWARGQHDVLALAVAGSHARGTARPDSDLDLVLILRDPGVRLADIAWLSEIAPHTPPAHEDWGLVQALRTHMMDVEVELGLTSAKWMMPPIDPKTTAVISDGIRILWDPHGQLASAVSWVQAQE